MGFFHELCHQDHAWRITFYLDSNLITNTLDTIEIVKRFAFGRKQNHGHSGIFQEGHAQGVVNLMLPPPFFPFPQDAKSSDTKVSGLKHICEVLRAQHI